MAKRKINGEKKPIQPDLPEPERKEAAPAKPEENPHEKPDNPPSTTRYEGHKYFSR